MNPNRIIATFLTDEDLLAQFGASDGVSERALELLGEIEERGIPYEIEGTIASTGGPKSDSDRDQSVP